MNILYYCDEYPPARNGGIGSVVKLMAEAMARRGHDVVVVGKYWGGNGRETVEEINGVTVIRWHKANYRTLRIRFNNILLSENAKKRYAQTVLCRTQYLIEQIISQYGIDLLEMPDYVDDFMHNDHLKVENLKFSIPMIVRVHGSTSFLYYYLTGQTKALKLRQDREHLNRADAICAVSGFSKYYVQEHLSLEKDVDVIYNPVEASMFENPMGAGGKTILFFGKIAEMKGVPSLVKAFNIVAEKHPEARLRLIGNGNVEMTKRLVDVRFTDRVEFGGFVPRDRIASEIDKALFCVLPSYFENFSMAALEVLARKRALIYTNRASGPELIEDGYNGFLVDPDNVEQLAERMSLLLDDAELRERMAFNGYEMCRRRFSTEVIVPQMEQYYKNVIQRCRK